MSAKKQIEKEIREAYIFLREKNMSVPSETLQFMLDASLEKLQGQSLPIDSVSKQSELFICSFCKSDQTYLSEGGYVRTCLRCDESARVNQ
jgi:hypothetical protein